MNQFTPEEIVAQLKAKNGTAEERAAALAVLASVLSETISLGPAKVEAKANTDALRLGIRPSN